MYASFGRDVWALDKDPPSEFDSGRHDPNPSNDEATITVRP
jgi:hypothetical protein